MANATEETLQDVLDAVTTPSLPSGIATSAKQDTGNTSLASLLTGQSDGTQKSIVVDLGLAFIAGGVTSCAASTLVATAQTGAGYLFITNREAIGGPTVYRGPNGVTTNGHPLSPGESISVRVANVTTIYAAGSTTVGWSLWR